MSDIKIRLMTAEDMTQVLSIQEECYTEVEPESSKSLLSKLNNSSKTCWVSVSEEEILGYLICHPWAANSLPPLNVVLSEAPKDGSIFYIHDLAIGAHGRGKGLGQALVENALSAARDLNFTEAALIAVQNSIGLWQRFGFTKRSLTDPTAQEKLAAYGDDAVYMVAELGSDHRE